MSLSVAVPEDLQLELVRRIAGSSAFRTSKRLRDFLLFVCERARAHPEAAIREDEIAAQVFGRRDEFDATQDTLVRVHGSRLRKRLEHYFENEGRAEPMVLEIPKGGYTPRFRTRQADTAEPAARVAPPVLRPWWPRLLCTVLCAASLGFFLQGRAERTAAARLLPARPHVDRLWRQMFGNGLGTTVVLADSNITLFQDAIRHQLSVADYQYGDFPGLAANRVEEPGVRELARRLANRQCTGMPDVHLARRLEVLNLMHGIPTQVIFARYARPETFTSQHAILSGSRRANPWIASFEDRLNFRNRFDEANRRVVLENRSPRAGEKREYDVQWDARGYGHIAYLPNLDRTGTVLLVSGTDMVSVDASSQFITSDAAVEQLLLALDVGANERVPYFEVVLEAQLVLQAATRFEMIAHRVIEP
jgi:hypothetical protein